MEKCNRCKKEDGQIMSIFKTEILCLKCKRKETQTKEYKKMLNFVLEKELKNVYI